MTTRDVAWMNANTSAQPDYSATDYRLAHAAHAAHDGRRLGAGSGVVPADGDELLVSHDGSSPGQVSVQTGQAWIDATLDQGAYLVTVDAAEVFAVPAHSAVQRTDRVVLRANDGEIDVSLGDTEIRSGSVEYLTGDTGTGAAQPVPDNALLLAEGSIPAGAGTPTWTDMRVWQARAGMIGLPVSGQSERDALTPTEGASVWRKDEKRAEVYDGSAWAPVGAERQFKIKPADELRPGQVTMANDNDLFFTVDAGATYMFEFVLYASANNEFGNADISVRFTYPAGTLHLGAIGPELTMTNSIGQAAWLAIPSDGSSPSPALSYGCPSSGAPVTILLRGVIAAAGSGTVRLQWAQNLVASTTTLHAGSHLRAEKVA